MTQEPQFYVGVVEDRMDPLKLGRVRVRVLGLHTEDKSLLPTEDLPWAYKIQPTTSGAISGIGYAPVGVMEGTWVAIQYIDPDKQIPFVVGTLAGYPLGSGVDLFEEMVAPDGVAVGGFDPNEVVEPPQPIQPRQKQPVSSQDVICGKVDISDMVNVYGENVRLVANELCAAGIRDPFAIIAILGNVAKETKFVPQREDTYYRSVERIREVYPSSVANFTDTFLQKYVENSKGFADFIYANKLGNGGEDTGDGYKYRGGGFIQLTGKENYRLIGSRVGVDLETQPALVGVPDISARTVAQYYITRYGSASAITFSSYEAALVDVTRTTNPGRFRSDFPIVKRAADLCSIVGDPQELPDEENQQPSPGDVINDPVYNTQSDPSTTGFCDPNKKYPLQDMLGEPDTNRLARNESIDKTVVYTKEQRRHRGVQTANNKANWDQPSIPYSAEYPFNNVYQSESGHLLEFDDTPGRERVHQYHRAGTYTEIDSNGTKVDVVRGDAYTIYERNGRVHVSGNVDVTVEGAKTLLVKGTCDVQIYGDAVFNVHNNAKLNVAKNLDVVAGGNLRLKARNRLTLSGERIDFNTSGTDSGLSYLSIKRIGKVELPDLPTPDRGDDIAITYEAMENDFPSVRQNYKKKMIQEGAATDEEMEEVPETKESASPQSTVSPESVICGIPQGQTQFTGKEKLSKYFTLSDLTSNNTRKIVPQNGLLPAQIFCNLKALAVNVLDPIKQKYPDMDISSGFRRPGDAKGSSTKSQHNTGQAVDIKFPGKSREELYEIALEIQKTVPYDQLILEYATGPGWIHISYNTNNLRRQHFTMVHHKRVSPNLRTLVKV